MRATIFTKKKKDVKKKCKDLFFRGLSAEKERNPHGSFRRSTPPSEPTEQVHFWAGLLSPPL